MDRVHVGQVFRALRRRQRLRQIDLARRARLSQQTVSDVECGHFGSLSVDTYCRLAEALGAEVVLMPHWRGPKLARLLDARHARMQDALVKLLTSMSWVTHTEGTFNHYGDRGSVDVLAWFPDTRTLLIVEIKTEIDSIEEMQRSMNMKARVVPGQVARGLGWRPLHVGLLLVLPEGSTHRDIVARHASLFAGAYPSRNIEVRRWLADPRGDLRGLLFLKDAGAPGGADSPRQRHRIRTTAPGV